MKRLFQLPVIFVKRRRKSVKIQTKIHYWREFGIWSIRLNWRQAISKWCLWSVAKRNWRRSKGISFCSRNWIVFYLRPTFILPDLWTDYLPQFFILSAKIPKKFQHLSLKFYQRFCKNSKFSIFSFKIFFSAQKFKFLTNFDFSTILKPKMKKPDYFWNFC